MYDDYARNLERKRFARNAERLLLNGILALFLLSALFGIGWIVVSDIISEIDRMSARMPMPGP